jgi:Cys-tRNA(Pro)/Cys-tRNA(Cys) deacylase
MMPQISNVIRMLEARKVPFKAYELPAEKLRTLETARLLKVPPEMVFKTIVITREKPKKPILAVIPGPNEVDLKALAQFLGEKKVHLPSEREAEEMTGLQAGGISPLALLNKGFMVIVDASAQADAEIHISGGQRGLNIRLPVEDLVGLTRARIAIISK